MLFAIVEVSFRAYVLLVSTCMAVFLIYEVIIRCTINVKHIYTHLSACTSRYLFVSLSSGSAWNAPLGVATATACLITRLGT